MNWLYTWNNEILRWIITFLQGPISKKTFALLSAIRFTKRQSHWTLVEATLTMPKIPARTPRNTTSKAVIQGIDEEQVFIVACPSTAFLLPLRLLHPGFSNENRIGVQCRFLELVPVVPLFHFRHRTRQGTRMFRNHTLGNGMLNPTAFCIA